MYWFWLNGNITKEGITADLEAMKRVGIGGALIMEVDQGVPLGPVSFAGSKWRQLFRHVLSEAQRLGLEINMNDDAGWNGSGGPWIRPDVAMQKLVWSETTVDGGAPITIKVQKPLVVGGYYKDVAVQAIPVEFTPEIENREGKSALVRNDIQTGPISSRLDGIPAAQVINLKLESDGAVKWTPPAGKWTILRFGHTLTGAENAPAPASGRGLECDKLSKAGIEAQFKGLIQKLVADSPSRVGKSFVATHIDSWENHSQNWTPKFREEFRRLRGYDPTPYLPVMTGRIVLSEDISERFLWDVRRTVADLIQENYAGHMHQLAAKYGLKLTIEAYGDAVMDDMAYAGRADEPMAEFWSWPGNFTAGTVAQMVSAAHVYGKPIIGAEAFTAGDGEKWRYHPATLKALGDWAFCEGINRFVFHRYAMQPWIGIRPGMGMGPWGVHYERTQTWWELTRPWHHYLSRCQFLLRQGKPVVDLLYLTPEGAPSSFTAPSNQGGYRADACPSEVVLQRLSVKSGKLMLPDGMTYQALVLPGGRMTPKLLVKVEALARQGAKVYSSPITAKSPSLEGYPNADQKVKASVERLWKNRFVQESSPDVLKKIGIQPDFISNHGLNFIHRRVGTSDLYFVSNPKSRAVQAQCTFRAKGIAEVWDPETGTGHPVATKTNRNGTTSISLYFTPSQSTFVVFRSEKRDETAIKELVIAATNNLPVSILKATWGPQGDETRTKDVTSLVVSFLKKGEEEFRVSDLAVMGDPAYGVVKTLTVDYLVGDNLQRTSAKDPETFRLNLPDDPAPTVERNASDLRVRSTQAVSVATKAGYQGLKDGWFGSHYLTNGWTLSFPSKQPQALPNLVSWSEMADEQARYFSGTAVYRQSFNADAKWLRKGQHVLLDLGRVEAFARVKLNGKEVALLWKAPYRCDLTAALKSGKNQLEIEVTNLWPNRLIGDERLPADSERNPDGTLKAWPAWLKSGAKSPTGRSTFATWRQYGPNDPLLPSGLLGPVKLIGEVELSAKAR